MQWYSVNNIVYRQREVSGSVLVYQFKYENNFFRTLAKPERNK